MRIERHIETVGAARRTTAAGDARARALIIGVLVLLCVQLIAQERTTTFGIQMKPVIPLAYFDPLTVVERPNLRGEVELMGGFSFGMNVRAGITNAISFETGISQIRRAYDFRLVNDSNGYSGDNRVRYVGYEIPIQGLVYIRLGERSWMSVAMGFSLDMYPSDVQRDVEQGRIYIFRYNWIRFGVLGNMGVEYRTDKSGTFYLGGSFHRPFNDMAEAEFTYYGPQFFPYHMRTPLDGSYLTLDLRYYFYDDVEGMRMRKRLRELR